MIGDIAAAAFDADDAADDSENADYYDDVDAYEDALLREWVAQFGPIPELGLESDEDDPPLLVDPRRYPPGASSADSGPVR